MLAKIPGITVYWTRKWFSWVQSVNLKPLALGVTALSRGCVSVRPPRSCSVITKLSHTVHWQHSQPAVSSLALHSVPESGSCGCGHQPDRRLLLLRDWCREPQKGTTRPCTQTHAGPCLYASLCSSVQQASRHFPIQGSYQRFTIHTTFGPGGCCAHSNQCNCCTAQT